MKEYQAYGKAGKVTRQNAKDAAIAYFQQFPKSRKCSVIEGESDGMFFTVKYGNKFSSCGMPFSIHDVTKKQIDSIQWPSNRLGYRIA